ncbi:DNA ligase [Alteromonas sp. W364]|uniref:DNA ligase n=1 Tax=Alteromonas sp. W364 TaxID=3075610 RepID=UPI00288397AD|nr:DNA ligase [Alteromonas sp. W364]MDT0629969.1 DNA ligase [Alteromonas sp. W364]
MITFFKSKPYEFPALKLVIFVLFNSWCIGTSAMTISDAVEVQLAKVYEAQDVQEYLVSEKFDGVRAIWRNRTLMTRQGNMINAPAWFTEQLPDMWLDGELWISRNTFEEIASIVSRYTADNNEWKRVKYMVFDAPNFEDKFTIRSKHYTSVLLALNLSHVLPVEQLTLATNHQLTELLMDITQNGAEGLMLHKADSDFQSGRSDDLLKLKPYMDSEALVLGHIEGKGKYSGLLGSLLVQSEDKNGNEVTFKIGTGFTDSERKTPPAIGSTITFTFHGYTKNGVPRFASFLRIAKMREALLPFDLQ